MASGRYHASAHVVCVVLVSGAAALTVVTPSFARPAQNLNAKVKALATGLSEFSGRVTSSDPDCVKGRTITISAPKQALGKAKTDKEGRFFLTRKTVQSGTKVTFDLKARGKDCIPLVATLEAP
jgi:hypothetical protein